jgi:hypothetical protein
MNPPEIQEFIKNHSELFWYIPEDKKPDISQDLLVETIMNYGTLDDFKALLSLRGKKELSRSFFNAKGRKKLNYFPEIYNFFSLYLKKNA